MKIKTDICKTDKVNIISSAKVILIGKAIYPLEDFELLKKDNPRLFEYDFNDVIKLNYKNKLNTKIKYFLESKNRQQLYCKLNILQRNKLRLMFNDHHLQKHWKLYVGWFGVPLIALLVSKLTGILDMLMQAMSNK